VCADPVCPFLLRSVGLCACGFLASLGLIKRTLPLYRKIMARMAADKLNSDATDARAAEAAVASAARNGAT
jgi:hypothetical protein